MNTKTLPAIRVTAADYDRLSKLLESPTARTIPGTDALARELDRADIVDGEVPQGEFVTMGSTARFTDVSSDKTYELTLVYPHDVDGSAQHVSILAPMGSALLGLSVGQEIAWAVPGGRQIQLRVLEIFRDSCVAGA